MLVVKWIKSSSVASKAQVLELGFERNSGIFCCCPSLMGSACFTDAGLQCVLGRCCCHGIYGVSLTVRCFLILLS